MGTISSQQHEQRDVTAPKEKNMAINGHKRIEDVFQLIRNQGIGFHNSDNLNKIKWILLICFIFMLQHSE